MEIVLPKDNEFLRSEVAQRSTRTDRKLARAIEASLACLLDNEIRYHTQMALHRDAIEKR